MFLYKKYLMLDIRYCLRWLAKYQKNYLIEISFETVMLNSNLIILPIPIVQGLKTLKRRLPMKLRHVSFMLTILSTLIYANPGFCYMPRLNPESFERMYSLAASGKTEYLLSAINRGMNINAVNNVGDTGLCVAAKKRNKRAFQTFLMAGANPSHPCTLTINGYDKFLAAATRSNKAAGGFLTNIDWSKVGWLTAGTAAAGVGIAALGGSGGGGSGGEGPGDSGGEDPGDSGGEDPGEDTGDACLDIGGQRTMPSEGYKYTSENIDGSVCYFNIGCQADFCGSTCQTAEKQCDATIYPYQAVANATMGESCTPQTQSSTNAFACESGATLYKSFECNSGYKKSADQQSCEKIECNQGQWNESLNKCVCFFGYTGDLCDQATPYNNINAEETGAVISREGDMVVNTITKSNEHGLVYQAEGEKAGDSKMLYNGYYEVANEAQDIDHKWVIDVARTEYVYGGSSAIRNESGDVTLLYVKGTGDYKPSGTYISEVNVKNPLDTAGRQSSVVYADGNVTTAKCENCAEDVTLQSIINGENVHYGIYAKKDVISDGNMKLTLINSDMQSTLVGDSYGPRGIYAEMKVITGKGDEIYVKNAYNGYGEPDTLYYGATGIESRDSVTNYGKVKVEGDINSGHRYVGIKADRIKNYGEIDARIGMECRGTTLCYNMPSGTIYSMGVRNIYGSTDNAEGMLVAEFTDGGTLTNDGTIVIGGSGYGMVGGLGSQNIEVYNTGTIRTMTEDEVARYPAFEGKNSFTGIYNVEKVQNDGEINLAADGPLTGISGNIVNNDGNIYLRQSEATGTDTATGIYGTKVENHGKIDIETNHYGQGIRGVSGRISNDDQIKVTANVAIGIDVSNSTDLTVVNEGEIIVTGTGTYNASGIRSDFATNSNIRNSGEITVNGLNGDTYGIHADSLTVNNSGKITVNGLNGKNYGIYATDHSTVINGGEIIVNGLNDKTYGIYAIDHSTVTNTGTITVNNDSCSGDSCSADGKHIYIDETSTLQQAAAVNFGDDFNTASLGGGKLDLLQGGSVKAASLSGEIGIAKDVVAEGFNDTYTLSNAIIADDTSGLNIKSRSVMFRPVLEGQDVVLERKPFREIVRNDSFADVLENNYKNGQNENLFKTLKSKSNMESFNGLINDLEGKYLTRFVFDDMRLYEQLNFDMNKAIFENKEKKFTLTGSSSPLNYTREDTSNTRWMMSGHTISDMSYGVGFAFSRINDQDSLKTHKRQDDQFQMMFMMGYNKGKFKFLVTPRLGYAYGHYTRDGYDGNNFEGKIGKQLYGITGAVRYQIKAGEWTLTPQAEINMMSYHLSGYENDKPYALKIDSQDILSFRGGLGIFVDRAFKLANENHLKINSGVMMYHEFAEPYSLKLSMCGLQGNWRVRDEKQKDNHFALTGGLEYNFAPFSIYSTHYSYLDSRNHQKTEVGLKWHF